MLALSAFVSHYGVGRCVQLLAPLLVPAALVMATLPRALPRSAVRSAGREGMPVADASSHGLDRRTAP
jgi:hypothetical protein